MELANVKPLDNKSLIKIINSKENSVFNLMLITLKACVPRKTFGASILELEISPRIDCSS